MKINSPMLRRYVYRLLRGSTELYSLASDSWSLHPEGPLPIPKATFLEPNLESIRKISPWRNWENEKLMIHGGQTGNIATRCHAFDDVHIRGSYFYVGPCKSQQGFGTENLFSRNLGRCEEIQEAQLVTTWSGSKFFGCLLLDDYPLELISETPPTNIRMVTKSYQHDAGYRELLGLNDIKTVKSGFVHRLTMYEDPIHSTNKAQRYRQLRANLAQRIPPESRSGGKLVYIGRPDDGQRRVFSNTSEFYRLITRLGFETVDPENLSSRDISAKVLNAEIVMGVEGSHLSHAIFSMRENASLVVIQPPQRFAMNYKEYTDCLGMNFAFIVGNDIGGDDFTVDLDDLQKLLERC